MNIIKGNCILMAFFACLLCTMMSCEKEPEPIIHINKETFTPEEQIEIGNRLKTIIEESPEFDILDKEEYTTVYSYLNTLLFSLANTPEVQNRTAFDWEVTIIKDDNTLSAFTAPGGQIFLYTGLLKFIEAQNEISCLLGHEMKYVDDESLIQTLKSTYGGDVLGDILLGHDTEDIKAMAYGLRDISFSENKVIDADDFTMKMHCNFNYDVRGIKTLINRADSTSTEMLWMHTRPSSNDRLNIITNGASNCGGENIYAEPYHSHKNLLP